MSELARYEPHAIERLDPQTVKGIAGTDLIPKPLRGNVPAIIATILKGRALGLDDMHSLTAIHFIDGKATLSTETMVMLARRAGHSITGEFTDGAVTARGKRDDNGDEMAVTWTIEMAKRANLIGKDNWKKYPESMLWARAASQLCRMLFADVLAGAGYTAEELELSPEEQVSEDIGRLRVPQDEGPNDDVVDAEAVEVSDEDSDAEPAPPGGASDAAPDEGAGGSEERGEDAAPSQESDSPAPREAEQTEMTFARKAEIAQRRKAEKERAEREQSEGQATLDLEAEAQRRREQGAYE